MKKVFKQAWNMAKVILGKRNSKQFARRLYDIDQPQLKLLLNLTGSFESKNKLLIRQPNPGSDDSSVR